MRRSLALPLAGLLALPATALAQTGTDLWQGTAGNAAGVTITRQDGKRHVDATINYSCKNASGIDNSLSTTLSGNRKKNNRIKLKGAAFNGAGKASIKAKVKTGKKAKGSFKISVDYDGVACTVSRSFKLKYSHATGG